MIADKPDNVYYDLADVKANKLINLHDKGNDYASTIIHDRDIFNLMRVIPSEGKSAPNITSLVYDLPSMDPSAPPDRKSKKKK